MFTERCKRACNTMLGFLFVLILGAKKGERFLVRLMKFRILRYFNTTAALFITHLMHFAIIINNIS